MRKTIPCALLAAAMMTAPAMAQEFPTTRAQLDITVGQFFAGADRNGDSQLDRAETAAALGIARSALAQPQQMPFSLDTDPDGRPRINIDQGGVLNVLYQGIDSSGDDRLSLGEVRAAARERFDAADANRDGTLDKTELAAAKRQFGSIAQAVGAAR